MASTIRHLRGLSLRQLSRAVQRPAAASRRPVTHMAAAKQVASPGDFVQVHYTGTLDDGSVFDSSRPRDTPLEFLVGGGKVIKGFDLAVTGLAVGESRKSRIEPADAYGEVNPELVIRVPASRAPPGLKAGLQVQLSNGMVGTCTKIDDKEVVLDLNHELAGKPLTFDVELVALTPKDRMATATLGMGCFWSPQLRFQRVPGVVSTSVGYANYTGSQAPDYDAVCTGQTGAVEVVQVLYDRDAVTFEQLLDVFWEGHDPTTLNRQGGDQGTQYRSGVYVSSPEELDIAQKSKQAAQKRFSSPIVSEITTLDKYTNAEPYHQEYLARGGRFGRPQNPAKNCNDPIRCYG